MFLNDCCSADCYFDLFIRGGKLRALLCHLGLFLTTRPLLACALDLRKLGIKSVLEDGDRLTASLAPSSRPVGLSLRFNHSDCQTLVVLSA